MTNFLSKVWPLLSVTIIALLVAHTCVKTPASTSDDAIAMRRGYDSARAVDTPVIRRLALERDSIAHAEDSIISEMMEAQEDLQSRAGDLSATLKALDQAKIDRDTAAQLRHYDTLEAQVKSGIPAVEGYTHLSDSLIQACIAQREVQDALVAKLQDLGHVADRTIATQQLQYEILHKDDLKKTAQIKFYKPAAIGAGVGLAAIIVLKLIAH